MGQQSLSIILRAEDRASKALAEIARSMRLFFRRVRLCEFLMQFISHKRANWIAYRLLPDWLLLRLPERWFNTKRGVT